MMAMTSTKRTSRTKTKRVTNHTVHVGSRNKLLSHLTDGGLAVLPVGPEDEQMLVTVTRRGPKLDVAEVCPCRFVKLIGAEGWTKD